jgi:hypothetical protein
MACPHGRSWHPATPPLRRGNAAADIGRAGRARCPCPAPFPEAGYGPKRRGMAYGPRVDTGGTCSEAAILRGGLKAAVQAARATP